MNVLQMSFYGAVLILVVVFIRFFTIHKLPKKTFLVLWGIVLFRLLIPFSIPSALSIYSAIDHQTSAGTFIGSQVAGNDMGTMPKGQPGTVQNMQQSVNNVSTGSLLLIIWCIGVILFMAFFILSYERSRIEFRAALPVHNDFVEQWLKSHQIKRPLAICQSDKISAPLTYGILHPVILMPKKTDWADTEQLQYVFLHEYVHICHYDAVIKLLSTFTLCIHWFNPFVWAMYLLFNRDIELACDESVVHQLGENSKSLYARMLISMEVKKSGLTPFCNNFSKNAIEERITAIMKIKKNTFFVIFLAVALIIGVTTTFATTAANTPEKTAVVPDTNFSDEEYAKLLALQFPGYEEMTVAQFQNQVWKLTDTTEYRTLLERFSQDETLNEMKDSNEIASFMFYTLEPLTAEKWQTRGFGGYVKTDYPKANDNATLEYYITLTIENADLLTVQEYNDARSGMGNGLQKILKNSTTEQLQDEKFMKGSIDAEIERLTKTWDTNKLQMAVEYAFRSLSLPEEISESSTSDLQKADESRSYSNGTEDDYRSLLALKTPDYQKRTIADFNMDLLDWANENYERMERISMDTSWNDYAVTLSKEEKTFVSLTVWASGMENAQFVKSNYTGKTEEDPIAGGFTLEKESVQAGLAAWCHMYYQFSYHISDKEAVTVGERDRCLGGMQSDIQEFWNGTDIEDLLKMTESDILKKLKEIAEKYSDNRIRITVREDNVGFECMDERNKV